GVAACAQRNSDVGVKIELLPVELEGLGQLLLYAGGYGSHVAGISNLWEEYTEIVFSQTRCRILWLKDILQAPGNLDQQLVTIREAQAVYDHSQVIEADGKHSKRGSRISPVAIYGCLDPIDEQCAIR